MPVPPPEDAPVFPVLVLPEVVLFPRVTMPVYLFEEREMALLEDLLKKKGPSRQGRPLLVVSLCQWDSPYPQEARPNPVGTLAEFLEAEPDTGGERRVVVRGLERVQLSENVRSEPYLLARIEPLTHEPWRAPRTGRDLKSDLEALRERAELLAFRKDDAGSRQVLNTLQWIDDPGALADYVAHHFVTDWYVRQEVLEITDPAERLRTVLDALGYESEARP